jgi:endoglycosylceramidase
VALKGIGAEQTLYRVAHNEAQGGSGGTTPAGSSVWSSTLSVGGKPYTIHKLAAVEAEERNFDEPGRRRPVAPAAYANGSCPENRAGAGDVGFAEPPICGVDAGKGRWAADTSATGRNDFAQARALGFNIVRLCLSWSELEATPGVYDGAYVERVAQMVAWAREQGVYVILDLHEDLYSLYIQPAPGEPSFPPYLTPTGGQDGAPAWAVQANGWPTLAIGGVGDLNLAVLRAFDNFYNNSIVPGVPQGAAPGPGLQDHYIGALAVLAARFANEPTVAGWEVINEPLPGWRNLLDPAAQARESLFPLYRRAVQAITGERDGLPDCPPGAPPDARCAYADLGVRDTRHAFFVEPSALRNTFDATFDGQGVWTNYTNIVFTP